MPRDTKLLQTILDNQKTISDKIDGNFKTLHTKIDKVDRRLTARLDKIGGQLAYLEDDAPTIKEFNKLKRKVIKLEAVVYKAS